MVDSSISYAVEYYLLDCGISVDSIPFGTVVKLSDVKDCIAESICIMAGSSAYHTKQGHSEDSVLVADILSTDTNALKLLEYWRDEVAYYEQHQTIKDYTRSVRLSCGDNYVKVDTSR